MTDEAVHTASEDAANDPETARLLGIVGADDAEGQESEAGDDESDSEEITLEKLPESWQKEIERLRKESARWRTKAQEAKKTADPNATLTAKDLQSARDEARQEARFEFGEKLAAARIEAALTGLVPDPAEIVGDLNLAKYVDDDGEVDVAAITSLKSRYQTITGKKGTRPVGHARSGNGTNTHNSAADQFADAIKDLF